MSGGITIQIATESDLKSIKPILLELTEAVDSANGFDAHASLENCRVLMKDPAHCVLVAKEKGTIVGFANVSLRKTMLHPRSSGLIDELIVARNVRGRGIGKQLLFAAIERCRELGCCEVEVSTEKGNAAAREFYRKCGFEDDAVVLELHLEG
jgi:ribosomal protein S18 acetylase RimI-like enzyme